MPDLEQQVAKDLADSGLFGWAEANYPTVAQSDTALDEMELQLCRGRENWLLVEYVPSGPLFGYAQAVIDFNSGVRVCFKVGTDQRELANNMALAWLSKQESRIRDLSWKPKLKAALERLGWV